MQAPGISENGLGSENIIVGERKPKFSVIRNTFIMADKEKITMKKVKNCFVFCENKK